MCGIVGYIGTRPAIEVLIPGLARLEYRGYDSAGVGLFVDGKIEVRRSPGKLENVDKLIQNERSILGKSTIGIGHTRWATHGKPTTRNAHPHRMGHVVLVANGIIENYLEIREELLQEGFEPTSDTDSELLAILIFRAMDRQKMTLLEATREGFKRIHGACSIVVMSEKEPEKVIGVRCASPLVIAVDPKGGTILASDPQPILGYTKDVTYIEQDDAVIATRTGFEIVNIFSLEKVKRLPTTLNWNVEQLDKQGFAHYMLKEIYEQPNAIRDTLNSLVNRTEDVGFTLNRHAGVDLLEAARKLNVIACGTSFYASNVGKVWLEGLARMPTETHLASEFRYGDPIVDIREPVMGVSQSGETADTLAVVRDMNAKNIPTLALINVRGSTLARDAQGTFFTSAGPEIGVAATKSFSTQIMAMLCMAGHLGMRRGARKKCEKLFEHTVKLPHSLQSYLKTQEDPRGIHSIIKPIAKNVFKSDGFYFLGRGYSFPMALEGALKLKEIAYVNAEGYAAGELKHGPIAMIDEGKTVIALVPPDRWREKTLNGLEEVRARGARTIAIGAYDDTKLKSLADFWIPLPDDLPKDFPEDLYAFFLAVTVQLLSYEIAVNVGTDIDKPRNLAKSVTVE